MVTVMGLGRFKQGSGVGTAKWLMRHGAQIVITDLKTEQELRESVDEIMGWYTEYRKICTDCPIYQPVFVLGEHHEDDFTNVDLVVQNPDVPRESQFVQLAKKEGVPIESDVSLFFRFCPFPIYSITGTRGKSTTTTLLGEMLKQMHPKTVIAGNITRSPLEDLDWILQESSPVPIVLELSSWLLESLQGLAIGPEIAILTNAYQDHLNRYDSFEQYLWAKELIFKEQRGDQIAILNADQELTRNIGARIPAKRVFWFSLSPLVDGLSGTYRKGDELIRRIDETETPFAHVKDIKLEGEHNLMNVLSAALAAHLAEVPDEAIAETLKTFSGLPGRQEIVAEIDNVLFVNDTTATSPDGTIAALKRFNNEGNIILLAGGATKNLAFDELAPVVQSACKYVVLFEGTATDALYAAIGSDVPTTRVSSMKEAVEEAVRVSKMGDVILLSPGTASFGLFQNEFDRGAQFVNAVQKLQHLHKNES